MPTFVLRIETRKTTINQTYTTREEAQKALADLDLTNTTPGFAKTADGNIVVNRAEVVSANIIEEQGAVGFAVSPSYRRHRF